MSRNEVEMDLSKFMEMIQENAPLKDEIRDLKANDTVNPWQKWIHLARAVDSWRIWASCIFKCIHHIGVLCGMWFMELPEPSMEQSGLISILVGAGVAWFGLYVNSATKEHDTNAKK